MAVSSAAVAPSAGAFGNRWIQLTAGIVAMIAVANLQYGWTLFVKPIDDTHHWGATAIQVAYTTFILLETWLVPFEGYLVDRFGPKLLVAIGGVLVGLSWFLNSIAADVWMLYVGMAVGGVGAGIVYGTAVGSALKWFPDKRGLAAGLTAAGFGAGSALTIIPIANMINGSGYQATFLTFGLLQGVVVVIAALFLSVPRPGELPAVVAKARQVVRDFDPMEMLKQPTMTVMFGIQALTILALITTASNPLLFVIFSGLAFFSYGEIFSLFPAMSGDMFGRKYATTNYGLLYMSKGVAALLVPVGSWLQFTTGSWMPIFVVAIVLNAMASISCATILPRMRREHVWRASDARLEGAATFVPAVAGGAK